MTKKHTGKPHNNFNLADYHKYHTHWFSNGTVPKELKGFIVMCGVVFNDLKDIQFLWQETEDYTPNTTPYSKEYGQRNGINKFCLKTSIGIINEFHIFIEAHKDVLKKKAVQDALIKLEYDYPKSFAVFNEFINLKKGRNKKTSILAKIAQTRNNSTFHYYGTELLLNGMNKYISETRTYPQPTKAHRLYVSYGETNEESRFFFSDAAITHQLLTDFSDKEIDRINAYIESLLTALRFFLENFIKANWTEDLIK